jgi:hypothetical protein
MGQYCDKDTMGIYSCKMGCKAANDCMTDGGAAACCNHACDDTTSSTMNCGSCGKACLMNEGCCTGSCQDIKSSLMNCGGCNKLCNPQNVVTQQCTMGVCGFDVCKPLFDNCSGNKADGCETDVSSDKNNCGKCKNVCPMNQQCSQGKCVSCGSNEVAFNAHCYYLDGSAGACDSGYSRAAESVLAQIKTSFGGLNYKHNVSQNCCIWTSDMYENYGMANHCNSNGPFTANDVSMGAIGCTMQMNHFAGQLTFCGSN